MADEYSAARPPLHDAGAAARRVVRQRRRHGLGDVPPASTDHFGRRSPAQTRHKLGRSRSISTCTQLRLLGVTRVGGPGSSTVCRGSVRRLRQHSEGDTRHLRLHDDIREGCSSEGDIRYLRLHDDIGKPGGDRHLRLCGCPAQKPADRQEGNTRRTGELHRELGSRHPLVQDRRASFRPGRWIQSGRYRIPGERLSLGH